VIKIRGDAVHSTGIELAVVESPDEKALHEYARSAFRLLFSQVPVMKSALLDRKLWDRLLSGLVFDALGAKESEKQAKASDINQLITATRNAAWESADPIGEGDEYRAQLGNGEQGSALTFENSLVHGSVMAVV